MAKSKVFMMDTNEITMGDSLIDCLENLWNHPELDLNEWINKGEFVAIKTHSGAQNQTRHLWLMYIRITKL